jgi:hypothetical protein
MQLRTQQQAAVLIDLLCNHVQFVLRADRPWIQHSDRILQNSEGSYRRMRLIADDDCRTRCTGGSKVGGGEFGLAYGFRYYW